MQALSALLSNSIYLLLVSPVFPDIFSKVRREIFESISVYHNAFWDIKLSLSLFNIVLFRVEDLVKNLLSVITGFFLLLRIFDGWPFRSKLLAQVP